MEKSSTKGSPTRIPCSYPNCNYFFSNLKEMKKHKTINPGHEYCARCDEDYEDEEQLFIHMIKSNKHIVCPVCGTQFGSEGGRDGHIRQFHRTAQNLTCCGCKSTFRTAAGLMYHIENDECAKIPKERLIFEQSKKLLTKEAWELSATNTLAATVDGDGDGEGGVPIYRLADVNRVAMANQPKHGGDANSVSGLADKHWPELPGEQTGLKDTMTDLMSFTDVSGDEKEKENSSWKGKGCQSSVVGTKLTYRCRSAHKSAPASTAASINLAEELRNIYKTWDPENFFDQFSGQYVCACGKGCSSLKDFEKHVLSKSKGTRRMQCPGCFRIFKSTAALVAHCESATTRCSVNEGSMFAQIIDEVSGGMIQMAGYNDDGTLRYEASKLDLQKTQTVGVDLNKIGW
ncbi:hypothetical protein BDW59DRAFT_178538 [Aspergillus cavernicola]|uniref:C2H2-type domain-containing protein n=1 Tax=Aspergillus cavernicola TaxID=176166 RepID=A0ABR4IN51_9EURO